MKITAVIINGRHGGRMFYTEYSPIIKMPIEDETQISMGEEYDKSVRIGDEIIYNECFRSVDKQCVLYSENGRWEDIKYIFGYMKQTYPIPFPFFN